MANIKKACERLMHEKEMLVQYGAALAARLASFDDLEALTAALADLSAAPSATGALPLLERVDTSLAYMARNPQYADTGAYSARLRQLQARPRAPRAPPVYPLCSPFVGTTGWGMRLRMMGCRCRAR